MSCESMVAGNKPVVAGNAIGLHDMEIADQIKGDEMLNESMVVGNNPAVAGDEYGQKIFRAESTVDNPKNSGRTKIHWFCVDRKEPIGQYEQLIEDYERGNDRQELGANEYFTETEIGMLREHLKPIYREEFRSIRRNLPIPGNINPYNLWNDEILKINEQGEISQVNAIEIQGCCISFMEKDCDLPFRVMGYVHQI